MSRIRPALSASATGTTSTPGRYFTGSSWVVERNNHHNRDTDIMILVDGTQYCDGRVERIISVDDDDLTISEARALARALIAASDEAEQMATYDAPAPDAARAALGTAHDHLIEGHAHAALGAAGLNGARGERAMQLVDQLHAVTDDLGNLIDEVTR